ncbi:MAG TPA: TonB-dependent receptor plug domain-containing protein, partial [Puia sp.]|nr:TonB-dependent receptor plug domain-containing protein [Puia sp.]
MTRICMTVSLLLFTTWAAGQPGNVSGTVKDADTKKAIAYCNIRLAGSSSGVVADSAGQFDISIPGDPPVARLIISHLNYATDTFLVNPVKNNYILWLKPLRSELDEVIVTGVSSATRIREIPVAVNVVSSKEIERTIESNIMDVLSKNVPGLNMVKTGPNISKPFIRGLGYNRVLTLYDGIRQEGQQWGDEHGIEVGAYTIERAEVIKGPASILYGSDALAGVINLIPAWKASDDKQLRTKIFSEYQSNNGLIGNGIQLMYGSSRWSFALLGSYRVARNYTNSFDGRVYNTGFREIAGSFTTAYKSNTGYSRLSLTLYDDLQGIPDGSRDSLTRKFTKQVFEIDADDIKHRPIVPEAELNSYALSPLHQHIQHYRIYNNSHYRLGKGSFDASIAFQENIRREYNHPTAASQAGMYVRLNTVNYGFRYNMAEHL